MSKFLDRALSVAGYVLAALLVLGFIAEFVSAVKGY
jgi:hypothetical protein